jgi:hypothetical protein
VLAFLPALRIGFFRDDYGWVKGAIAARTDAWWWFEPAKTDFRPIPKLTVLANLAWFGIDARGYAAFNLLVHAANVALLFALARRLSGDQRVAFVAATLFAVGAGHFGEAVYWMSGRTGLLADLWSLCALLAYDRWRTGGARVNGLLAFGAFGLALLSKESAVVLPAALAALELTGRAALRAALARVAPFAALAAVYIALQVALLRSHSDVVGTSYAFGPHVFANAGEYFARMLLPVTPSSMLVAAPAALAPALGAALAVLSAVAPLALLAIALSPRTPPPARFGALWAWIAILPYLALTFRTSTRYLYGPAQGVALVVATFAIAALDRVARRSPASARTAARAGAIALALVVGLQCAVLALAMERRRQQQLAERSAPQAELERLARDAGIRAP